MVAKEGGLMLQGLLEVSRRLDTQVPVEAQTGQLGSLGPLGFERAQHRQTLRPTVDGTRNGIQGYLAHKKQPPPLGP